LYDALIIFCVARIVAAPLVYRSKQKAHAFQNDQNLFAYMLIFVYVYYSIQKRAEAANTKASSEFPTLGVSIKRVFENTDLRMLISHF
jgi:hypothetical protein